MLDNFRVLFGLGTDVLIVSAFHIAFIGKLMQNETRNNGSHQGIFENNLVNPEEEQVMKPFARSLRELPLFSSLTEYETEMVLQTARKQTLDKNYVLWQEGETRDVFCIVLSGKIKICVYDDKGKEYVLDVLKQDDFFGELSLFEELSGSAHVITMEKSELLMIRRHDFLRLLQNHAFAVSVVRELARRLREANEKLKGFALFGVQGRILRYLMDIGEKSGVRVKDRIIIEGGPSQVEIANVVGCSRETVSRMIKSLVQEGRISVIKRQYTIRPVFL